MLRADEVDTARQPDGRDWFGLRGKVCVVTGAAGGIGSEVARTLAREGALVGVLDRAGSAWQPVVEAILAEGGKAIGLPCDIGDEASVTHAAARCESELGRCDVLVNNAGTMHPTGLLAMDMAEWDRVMAVNLRGALLCARSFARHMMAARQGAMVHVGSICGSQPLPQAGAYSVTKAGLSMLSQLLALELAEAGVRSNVVSPALVRTPLSEASYEDPDILRRRIAMVPSGRIAEPRDIAEIVLFLASERASYINGQEILVDGGLSQQLMLMIPRAPATGAR